MIATQELVDFFKNSGLKKQSIAERLGIPGWVITKWLNGNVTSYQKKQKELFNFIIEFKKNNGYMNK